MFAVAALVFTLAWALSTALVGFASFGAAPLWFLFGGPIVVATWLAVAVARLDSTEKPRLALSEQSWARIHHVGSSVVDTFVLFLSLSTAAMLVVYVLPLRDEAEVFGVAVALLASLAGAVKAACALRLPVEEGA